MTEQSKEFDVRQSYGLIVMEKGKVQHLLFKYVVMCLNYRYGLGILRAATLNQAAGVMRERADSIHAVFVIQRGKVSDKRFILTLNQQGKIPLFLVGPSALKDFQEHVFEDLDNTIFCPWEQAFRKQGSLGQAIDRHLNRTSIDELLGDEEIPYEELQKSVEQWSRSLETLPAIPEIVLRIMRLVKNPNCNVEKLERLLLNDPSIVQKLLKVVNSPVFAGAAKTGEWTLKEAVMRLGVERAAGIAQQVKLMNTFVRPEDSRFDLRRFWEHSVGTALMADRICTDQLVEFAGEIPFDSYWIGAILHDIGKLILGVFFWEHFENVTRVMTAGDATISFQEAESQLGEAAHHVQVGQMLLIKSNVSVLLVEAVKNHHQVDEDSDELTCLLYLANNLVKDLGFGYLPEETGTYPEVLLEKLKISEKELEKLKRIGERQVVSNIQNVVRFCLAS